MPCGYDSLEKITVTRVNRLNRGRRGGGATGNRGTIRVNMTRVNMTAVFDMNYIIWGKNLRSYPNSECNRHEVLDDPSKKGDYEEVIAPPTRKAKATRQEEKVVAEDDQAFLERQHAELDKACLRMHGLVSACCKRLSMLIDYSLGGLWVR